MKWSDEKKVRLLLRNLGTVESQKYCNYTLPCRLSEITFEGTVKILTIIFREKVSIFHTRYQILNLANYMKDNFSIKAGIVN